MKIIRILLVGLIGLTGVACIGLGVFLSQPASAAGGAIGIVFAAMSWRRMGRGRVGSGSLSVTTRAVAQVEEEYPLPASDVEDTDSLVGEMLRQGRCTLLLRPQIIKNLAKHERRKAWRALQEEMSMVPVGEVVLGNIDDMLDDGRLDEVDINSRRAMVVNVDAFFLDRYVVTNRDFYRFVINGGYEQMAIWDREIWPEVINFVDQTETPGPKYWQDGKYPPGEGQHPVIGVSWYEAAAYARWVGKRLSADAEWVKAGSWPVVLSNTARMQRKYPWGNSMEKDHANLWAAGQNGTVAADEYSDGVSVGGVHQLIGNVWEWTSDVLHIGDDPTSPLKLSVPMKSIRGGAFDTYFENQATCQFQSGENPVSRTHNIGFRCAVGICDLDPSLMTDLGADDDQIADDGPKLDDTAHDDQASPEASSLGAAGGPPASETNKQVEVTT